MTGPVIVVPRDLGRVAATPQSSRSRTHEAIAAGLALVAIALAAALAFAHRIGTFGLESDLYATYAPQAARLLAGESYGYGGEPPGYALLLAGASILTGGDFFVAGKLLSVLASGLFVGSTYLLVNTVALPSVALGAAALSLALIVPYSFIATVDLVGAVAILAPVWLVLGARRRWLEASALAGALSGAAYLILWNAIFLAVALPIAILLIDLERRDTGSRLRAVGAFAGMLLLTTAPWLFWNWATNGNPLAGTGSELVAAVLPHEPLGLARTYVGDVLLEYPRRLAESVLRFPAYLIAGAGLLLLIVEATDRRVAFMLIGGSGYALLALVGFEPRRYLFLVPLLCLFVAYFLFHEQIRAHFGRGPAPRRASWILCAVVATMIGFQTIGEARVLIASEPRYVGNIAGWLRQNAQPGDVIVTTEGHIPYLSGLTPHYAYPQTLNELLGEASRSGARYIVVGEHEVAFPGYAPLADTTRARGRGLSLVHTGGPPRTLIYELGR